MPRIALLAVVAVCLVDASPAAGMGAPALGHSRVPGGGVTSFSSTTAAASSSAATNAATTTAAAAAATTTTQATVSETPVSVSPSNVPPAGRRLTSNQVLAIARALPKMQALTAAHPGSFADAYLKGPLRWQVSFFTKGGAKEIGQVIIADSSGRVLEQWTGFQVAWTMARGYPGAFGRHVNSLYLWLPLCLLFLAPFINPRRPFSLLHLDLLVLLSLSVSLAFFNHGDIYASVPLSYPPLLYLLARMLWLLRRRPRRTAPFRLLVPVPWLAFGVVFLLGFRIALNVIDSNVIDVGYAGVIGAQKVADGRPLYGGWPQDNEHGDTYGPATYEAYVPFEQVFGFSGRWDDLPAAHGAAIAFDLLALALIFLLGLRIRGPTLGVALAYAWVAYPFTLFALESNSNDTLVAVFILAALLLADSPPARGAFAALAGLSKFAPLALAPVLATHGLRELAPRRRARALGLFLGAFAIVAVIVSIPALRENSLHEIYERTLAYQADRGSPFSVWGLYGGLHGVETGVQVAAVLLALGLAVAPRRPDVVGLAAACAAIVIATQLGVEHWFYLYIPWFFPLVMVAFLGGLARPAGGAPKPTLRAPEPAADEASGPARSSPLAAAWPST